MEQTKVILENNIEEVYSIFYALNNMYYLVYTDKSIDDNGYVILHFAKIGREVDGFVGVEITDSNELKNVQTSISKIVNDKKNQLISEEIKYLPISMLSTPVKILGFNTFRLKKDIMQRNFGLTFFDDIEEQTDSNAVPVDNNDNVIIDYRAKFFEEQEKNNELKAEINKLNEKLNQIKNILE